MHCLGAAFHLSVFAMRGGIDTGQASEGSESIRKSAGNPYLIHSVACIMVRAWIGQHIQIFIRMGFAHLALAANWLWNRWSKKPHRLE